MKAISLLSLLMFAVVFPVATAAQMDVECIRGCMPADSNQTVDLLLRPDESSSLTVTWRSAHDPHVNGQVVTLYAGNPTMREAITNRGPISFLKAGNVWAAIVDFSGQELGRGTFLAVLTARPKGSDPYKPSTEEEILDWRAFRLLTTAEKLRKEQVPTTSGAWSVTLVPALLQVDSGHGELPRFRGGDKKAWWSLVDLEGNTSDLDIDGKDTGVPGIGVQISTPWHTTAGEDWKQKILENLTGVEGHTLRFGGLEWREQPDRTLDLGQNVGPILLRNYYTVITLYTSASLKSFDEKEVGASHWFLSPTYFSHETTARLKHTDDPRFWASYSRREYSADKHLLDLLKRHVKKQGTVPGLGTIQVDDGDGGSVAYRVGFYAQVRPWEAPQEYRGRKFQAGFVGFDVVAARAGYGGVVSKGSGGMSSLEQVWCKVIRCNEEGQSLDLDKPPSGYSVTQPVASLSTLSGNLPMLVEKPELAERAVPRLTDDADAGENPQGVPNLPSRARFGLSASLRSGALLQEAGWGYTKNLVPINTYAQFVVKMTVAMLPQTAMVANDDVVMPLPVEFQAAIAVPKPTGFWAWLKEHAFTVGLAAVIGLSAIVLLFVPGGLAVIRSAFGVVTKFFQIILESLNRLLDKILSLVKGKKGSGP